MNSAIPAFDRDTLLNAHAHRHLRFDGACNVRDLGGLPTTDGRRTRHGVAYRADSLARLSEADLARLAALAVRTVVDLRTPEECARAPDRLPAGHDLTLHNPGFVPRGNHEMFARVIDGSYDAEETVASMIRQYRLLALEHLAEFRVLVSALLDAGRPPLLFHCASGKDRTGIAAAIVLLAVDVPRASVIEDYVISDFQRPPVDAFQGPPTPAVERVLAADPRYLEAALDAMVAEFGTIDTYLSAGLGLDTDSRRHLRNLLVA
ncbi:MAG: tyrosine-protein phosphatase [Gammaproteobacteria bacterium]